jgi:hypothetical protein
MKYLDITYRKMNKVLLLLSALAIVSCTFDDEVDPNRPSLQGVLSEASINQLNNLVVGTQSAMRLGLEIQTTGAGTMARELYLFDADPRNTADLLGANGTNLDNNSFYTTSPWRSRYVAIKNANILLDAIDNTSAASDAQKAGYRGFAKTVIAHELIQLVKSFNRARIDVSDPKNLGPIQDASAVFSAVNTMLDDALSDLSRAGSSFAFSLAGFTSFDSPSTFSQFNRALKAVVAVYSGDSSGALTSLSASFMDIDGDLTVGPKHVFSLNSGDSTNPIYKIVNNNGDQIIVHDSFMNDAEAGDTRVSRKTVVRANPASQDGLTGTHQTALYSTNVSSIDIVRNEELVLLYAEANIPGDLAEATRAINVIRNAAGLADYSGANTAAALTTELLHQRRYSLWCENHRMYDLRRYNLSSSLPLDRSGDQVFNVFPIPLTENE